LNNFIIIGGSDVNKLPIPDIYHGIPHPVHPSKPSNQFRYSSKDNRNSMIAEHNTKNPERQLAIPDCLQLG